MKEDFFTENIKKYFSDNRLTLLIFDAHGKNLLTIGKIIEVNQDLLTDFIVSSTSDITIKSNHGYVTLISSSFNNWYYYLDYSFSDYSVSIRFINIVIICCLIFVNFLGILLSFIAAHLNYKPIKSLYKNILPNTQTSLSLEHNEIKTIENYLQTLTAQNIEMSDKLEKEYTFMLNTMMVAVINGNISYQKNINIFKNSYYAIKYTWFCVLVYNVSGGAANQLFVDSLIIKASHEAYDDICIIPIKNTNQKIVSVIINSSSCVELDVFVEQFCEKISRECNIPVNWGIGSTSDLLDNISICYSHALIALTASNTISGINFYKNINKLMKPQMQLLAECRQRIQSSIKKMEFNTLPAYLESILSSLPSTDLQMFYYSNIISILLILCEQYNVPLEDIDDYLLVPHCSREKLIKNVFNLYSKLCNHVQALSEQSDQQLIKDILHFITINISDTTLTSQMIADHFNCSLSYLNKYFKTLIGITPTAFIDKKRLNMAASLIIDSNLQIKEICHQVGYLDVNNFIRKFKKIYGTSPSQYRHQISK